MLKFIGTEKQIKGTACVNATEVTDVGFALDQALYTEGEIYVYHTDIITAEEKAAHLNEELQMELQDYAASIKEGKLTVSRLLDDGFADDIIASVESMTKAATPKPKEAVSQEEVLAGLQAAGLELGMQIALAADVTGIITRFTTTKKGVIATLDVAGKEQQLHVIKLLEIKNMKMEEGTTMKKKINFTQATQNQNEGENTMANETVVNEVEATQAEKIAKSSAAQRLIQQAAAKAAAQKQKEEETKMSQAQPAVKAQPTQKEEEVKMNNQAQGRQGTVVGAVAGKMGQQAGAQGTRPARKLGTVDNRRSLKGASKEVMESIFDKPAAKETAANPYKGLPWFFNQEQYPNVIGEEILTTRKNEVLGITDISIYAPEDVTENPGDELAYIGVEIGYSIQLRFKIKEHTKEDSATPITTTNIKWFETRNNKLYPDYVFYRKNETNIIVKCACGEWNAIKEMNKAQNCKCNKPVGANLEVFGGQDVSSSYVAQRLPFGASIDRSVLAQVMMFAHLKLAPLFQ